jgi:hypothetical protein
MLCHLLKMKLLLVLICAIGLVNAEAEADPACNNCGQRPPYIKGARVSVEIIDL